MSGAAQSMTDRESPFSAAYARNYQYVYKKLYRALGNDEDARDLTQELFLRYYEKMRAVGCPYRWLMGAARLELLMHGRNSKHGFSIDDAFLRPTSAVHDTCRDARIIINEALNTLGGQTDRLIIQLVARWGLSYAETARRLGLTRRQVRYRYARACRSIISFLSARGIQSAGDLY
jgi:RNA polymerase sigma factor (sigma-70 family)